MIEVMNPLGFRSPQCSLWIRKKNILKWIFWTSQPCWCPVIFLTNFQTRKESKPHVVKSLLCFRKTCFIVWLTCQPILLVIYMLSLWTENVVNQLLRVSNLPLKVFVKKLVVTKNQGKNTFLFMDKFCMERKLNFILGM